MIFNYSRYMILRQNWSSTRNPILENTELKYGFILQFFIYSLTQSFGYFILQFFNLLLNLLFKYFIFQNNIIFFVLSLSSF